MVRNRLAWMFAGIVLIAAINRSVAAQSLNSKAPTPLVPGENRGTVDNQVGSQYWSFQYVAGKATISVRFTSMGLFGNPTPATIEVVLHNPDGKVFGSRPLTSNGRVAQTDWPGTFGALEPPLSRASPPAPPWCATEAITRLRSRAMRLIFPRLTPQARNRS